MNVTSGFAGPQAAASFGSTHVLVGLDDGYHILAAIHAWMEAQEDDISLLVARFEASKTG